MWRSSTMTVGVPVGTSRGDLVAGEGSGFGCTLTSFCGTAGSWPITCDSSSVSSATSVPLLGTPEVPEAEAQCEHCPEYAGHPHRRRWVVAVLGVVGVDEDLAHPFDE